MRKRNFVLTYDMMRRDVRVLKWHGRVKGLLTEWDPWVIYDYEGLNIREKNVFELL